MGKTRTAAHAGIAESLPPTLPGVVIIGCPRSGTSFLASLMEARFDWAAPVESHFVRYFDRLVRRVQPDTPVRMERLARAIFCFLDYWVPVNNRVRSTEASLDYSLAATRRHLPELLSGCVDYPQLVGRLFSSFAALQDRRGWIEQSVYAEPGDLRYLAHYPESTRVIHLARDGRDVWLSWKKTWFSPGSIRQAARFWRGHVHGAREWGAAHPSRLLEIRYEDLLAATEEKLREIGKFIGQEPCAAGAGRESGLAGVLATGGTHDLILQQPSRENREIWRRKMSPEEQAIFTGIAGAELDALGYPVASDAHAGSGSGVDIAAIFDRVRAGLAPNSLKRRAKHLLPVICWLRNRSP